MGKCMAQLMAIDNHHHKNLVVDPAKAELHGAELHLIPVVVGEFINLAVQYPIVLTKNGDTGEFMSVAMLGFQAHENLFWQDGQWQGIYLPLQIQRQPFFIANSEADKSSSPKSDSINEPNAGEKEYIVCIDLESPMLTDASFANGNKSGSENDGDSYSDNANGERIFTDQGEDSAYFSQAKNTLAQLLQGELDNISLLTMLKKLDLIQPLSLEITFINQQSTRLNGLYAIDQAKLAALPAEDIAQLHQLNLLQPIYTMIASLGQIYALIERKNAQLK